MKPDEIKLNGQTITVSPERRAALTSRLGARGGAGHAVEALRNHRPLTMEDKQVIYAELEDWLTETSSDELGQQLMNLRNGLQTDLDLGTKTH